MSATASTSPVAQQSVALHAEILTPSFEQDLENGRFHSVLTSPLTRILLGHDDGDSLDRISWQSCGENWDNFISRRAGHLLNHSSQESISALRASFFSIGVAALNAFLQSNVTGPPLPWVSTDVILLRVLHDNLGQLENVQRQFISSLSVDGETVYQLTPRVELFCLAKCLLNHEKIIGEEAIYVWGRLRVNFWHQRMLNENVDVLQRSIYHDLATIEQSIPRHNFQIKARFLVERATIHAHHGLEAKAREDLKIAAEETGLEFAVTGRLGKRTKFQQNELSQLVVLAKSAPEKSHNSPSEKQRPNDINVAEDERPENTPKPLNLDLNDDTLLESISFSKESSTSTTTDEINLPSSLSSLDAADQPTLHPLDSIILLAIASLITNTSPQDGLTRETTLPYATRVLTGSSTNWQIYTQALLVRSRIEGHRSRTIERGVLQLQAIVDQVIADTTPGPSFSTSDPIAASEPASTSFLPKPKSSESAPVSERLLYIHQLASPTRWKLEAELADRWVSLGGVRTALEIYERLQMWAEVALCWAASDREDEARKIICNQLYENSSTAEDDELNGMSYSFKLARKSFCYGYYQAPPYCKPRALFTYYQQRLTVQLERVPLPADAPRLFCILGDMDKSPTAYERAWEVSNSRYARAQRSLGRYYLAINDLLNADQAYVKSLKISPQNHSSWFALGSVRLQREDWTGAVDAFGRAIQIEEQDAESWSNLAVALVRLVPNDSLEKSPVSKTENGNEVFTDSEKSERSIPNPQKHTQEAFVALKRAAVLKRDSYRIWQNLLTVAVKLSPPPYTDIIVAQTRLIELLGNIEGEKCIDIEIVQGLLAHLIATSTSPPPTSTTSDPLPPSLQPRGFPHMLAALINTKIPPLITRSRRLWLLVAKLSLHQHRSHAALSSYEKAWRLAQSQPGWQSPGSPSARALWIDVRDATTELVDAYRSLGEQRREAGMGEGELVCKEWRFKARSALRGVLGNAKDWEAEDEDGYQGLVDCLAELRSG